MVTLRANEDILRVDVAGRQDVDTPSGIAPEIRLSTTCALAYDKPTAPGWPRAMVPVASVPMKFPKTTPSGAPPGLVPDTP